MVDSKMDWSSLDHLWDLLGLTSVSGIIHFFQKFVDHANEFIEKII